MNTKKIFSIFLIFVLAATVLTGCQSSNKETLKIYNWGEYIDPQIIKDFEAEYNVTVVHSTFDTNEAMYNKVVSGTVKYDLLVPSDYMIERMVEEDLLAQLDYSKIPNFEHIKPDLINPDFDKEQQYSVPYFWGTVGIIYDKTKVTKPVDSWNALWDDAYKQEIFMYNSSRDSIMVALKKLGFSMNTTNDSELDKAKDELLAQRPLVLGYVGDEVINSMINNQASLAVVYSGDATTIMEENENMEYVIPKEGSNIWIDSMVVPKNAENSELAHKFINYISSPEAALLNTKAVGYSTPNTETLSLLEAEGLWTDLVSYNPDLSSLENMEFFHNPGEAAIERYTQIWETVISS